jgi:hypothetical protein
MGLIVQVTMLMERAFGVRIRTVFSITLIKIVESFVEKINFESIFSEVSFHSPS